jgi:hypothetical protein
VHEQRAKTPPGHCNEAIGCPSFLHRVWVVLPDTPFSAAGKLITLPEELSEGFQHWSALLRRRDKRSPARSATPLTTRSLIADSSEKWCTHIRRLRTGHRPGTLPRFSVQHLERYNLT